MLFLLVLLFVFVRIFFLSLLILVMNMPFLRCIVASLFLKICKYRLNELLLLIWIKWTTRFVSVSCNWLNNSKYPYMSVLYVHCCKTLFFFFIFIFFFYLFAFCFDTDVLCLVIFILIFRLCTCCTVTPLAQILLVTLRYMFSLLTAVYISYTDL